MPIRIPTAHHDPLRKLVTMDASLRSSLVQAIRSASAVIDPSELISKVAQGTHIDEKTVSPIIWMLISMYRASEGSREDFAKQVAWTCHQNHISR